MIIYRHGTKEYLIRTLSLSNFEVFSYFPNFLTASMMFCSQSSDHRGSVVAPTSKNNKWEKKTQTCTALSITAKSEVAQATYKCFLGQKVIWHLSLVKKWDQGSKASGSLHLRAAGEGQTLIARLSLKVKVDLMAMVICLSSQHAFFTRESLEISETQQHWLNRSLFLFWWGWRFCSQWWIVYKTTVDQALTQHRVVFFFTPKQVL